jgi:O-acetyl-ADP-ribose deacetylase (regulator of RNase III)
MIKIVTKVGNLMNVAAGHIVHGCNAQGVMGSGVALAVKRKFPGAYEGYMNIHSTVGLRLGSAYPETINDNLIVWNAITQDGFGSPFRNTSYDAIATCFEEINETINTMKMSVRFMQHSTDVHIPMIGAARGGGNWEIIREIIEQTMDYPVTLWLPDASVDTR